MSKTKLVNITAVGDTTPLDQVYSTAMDHDAIADKLKKVNLSVFSRVRAEAKSVYERHLNTVGGDRSKLDGEAMRAEFKHNLEQAESAYHGKEPDRKAKNTWNKNKTDLCRCLLLCVDFNEQGQTGSSALVKICEEIEADIEEKANEKAWEDRAKNEGKSVEQLKSEAAAASGMGTGTSGDSGTDGKPADTAPPSSSATDGTGDFATASGITFADDTQAELFNEMIKQMKGVSDVAPEELTGLIKGNITQLSAKTIKLLKTFSKKAA